MAHELLNTYQVKIIKLKPKKEILRVLYYKYFENVIADIVNKNIEMFDGFVPDSFYTEEQYPQMYYLSESTIKDDKIADDFEFRYNNIGLCICVGRITTED